MEPEETVLTHGLKFGVVCTTISALICLFFYYDSMIKVSSGLNGFPRFSCQSQNNPNSSAMLCCCRSDDR